MLRGSDTLKLDPHFGAIPHAPRVEYPQVGPSLQSYPAFSEGRVPSRLDLTSELSHVLRGSRTLKLDPRFGAIPHPPRVAYRQVGSSLRSYPACPEGRVHSSLPVFSELPRKPRGLGTFQSHRHFAAFSSASTVVCHQFSPFLWGTEVRFLLLSRGEVRTLRRVPNFVLTIST